MNGETSAQDLKDRLNMIESMIAEGRRTTRSWGWRHVLWGIAFYVAIGWSFLGHSPWAWPITMLAAVIVTVIVGSTATGRSVETSMGRALGSIWLASSISIFVVLFALGFSGRLNDVHVFIAVLAGMLGLPNAATGLILRWRLQMGCAVVWWAAAVAACVVSANQAVVIFVIAVFIGMIAFGAYGMVHDSGAKPRRGEAHA